MRLSDRIGCHLKLHDLHVLMAVVQAGSMSKAAALLNTGQPAISRSISGLEQALGVRLLDRGPQGVKPTEYGRALLGGGTAVFDDLRQTVKSIAFLADPTVGEVRVGCSPFLAGSFVAAVIGRMARRYPRARFRLTSAYRDALYRHLTERNIDFVISRRSGVLDDERFDYEFLFEERNWVAVGAKNRLLRRRTLALANLMDEPWVLPPPETTTGSVALAAFRSIGLDYPRTAVIAEPVDVRISLLATGRFLSVFPDSVFRFSARSSELRLLPVKERLSQLPVAAITLKNRTIGPLARHFIETSHEVAAQQTKGKDGRRSAG